MIRLCYYENQREYLNVVSHFGKQFYILAGRIILFHLINWSWDNAAIMSDVTPFLSRTWGMWKTSNCQHIIVPWQIVWKHFIPNFPHEQIPSQQLKTLDNLLINCQSLASCGVNREWLLTDKQYRVCRVYRLAMILSKFPEILIHPWSNYKSPLPPQLTRLILSIWYQ